MRTDQFMGLNEWAGKLLNGCGKTHFTGKYETSDVVIREGEEELRMEIPIFESCVLKEESGSTSGMFDSEYPLYKYTMRDGTMYYEHVQAEQCSSGQVFFLALSIHGPDSPITRTKFYTDKGCSDEEFFVPESLWSDEEIANA